VTVTDKADEIVEIRRDAIETWLRRRFGLDNRARAREVATSLTTVTIEAERTAGYVTVKVGKSAEETAEVGDAIKALDDAIDLGAGLLALECRDLLTRLSRERDEAVAQIAVERERQDCLSQEIIALREDVQRESDRADSALARG
jgi:hypothetical protein